MSRKVKTPGGARGAPAGRSGASGQHALSTKSNAPSQAAGGDEPGATHADGMSMHSGGDLLQMFSRMPPVTLADQHKDAVMSVASGTPSSSTTITLLGRGTDSSGSGCERGHDVDALESWRNARRRRRRKSVIASRGQFTFG